MYSILLTDDEQIMIDSLKFIIKKNFPTQVELFSALSGTEALEIAAKHPIDIIFMDINMPGLNGLETLKYIAQSKPDTVVIILSAFDQFQYAQEALNLGAYKYLTKPVNRNTVTETVRGAMELVDKKRGQIAGEEELHKKLDLVSPMVESDFIYSAVFGTGKDVSDYFSYFDIIGCSWCLCCLEIPRIEAKNQYEVYSTLRSILTEKAQCIIGSFMLNRIVVFFSFLPDADGKGTALQQHVEELLTDIYRQLSIHICSGIRAGVSTLETDVTHTNAAYNQSLEVLDSVPADGGIRFAESVQERPEQKASAGEIAEKIFGRIRSGDPAMLAPLVRTYCSALAGQHGGDMDKIKNALFELLVNVRNITTEIDASYRNEAFDNAFSVLRNENSMEQLELFVQSRCSECAAAVLRISSQQENPIISKAAEFIAAHLAEDISLERIAQEINVSPFYLRKLFKEEKNENYISYLTGMRMEKARALLKEPRASIKEVSAAVGYNDQNYFSRIFRNKFGMTPTEFRDAAKK